MVCELSRSHRLTLPYLKSVHMHMQSSRDEPLGIPPTKEPGDQRKHLGIPIRSDKARSGCWKEAEMQARRAPCTCVPASCRVHSDSKLTSSRKAEPWTPMRPLLWLIVRRPVPVLSSALDCSWIVAQSSCRRAYILSKGVCVHRTCLGSSYSPSSHARIESTLEQTEVHADS